jgi:hypothetical protein
VMTMTEVSVSREPADRVEQQLATGLAERQIAEFVENEEVEPGEATGDAALPPALAPASSPLTRSTRSMEAATGSGADGRGQWRRQDGSFRCRYHRPAPHCAGAGGRHRGEITYQPLIDWPSALGRIVQELGASHLSFRE